MFSDKPNRSTDNIAAMDRAIFNQVLGLTTATLGTLQHDSNDAKLEVTHRKPGSMFISTC